MKHSRLKSSIFAFLLFLTMGGGLCTSTSWATDAAPTKIAILPFNMHTPSQMAYLQDGVREMLTSRLAWQGKVQVIDRTLTNQALQGNKGDISLETALKAGKSLKADYVLFGSITAMGQSISVDAKIAGLSGAAEPISLYAQTKSLDELLPKINQFSQEINQKLFGRPMDQSLASSASSADSESLTNRNPELLVPDTMLGGSGDRISYLNPNFVEVTSDASLRQPGLWRSQTIPGAVVGMDVGDMDGDGHVEMVTITSRTITVYRKENQALKTIASFEGKKVDHYLWVSVVDTSRDGHAKIFVTNLKKRNLSTPGNIESSQGDRGFTEELCSFGMSLVNGKLQVISEEAPYFLNAIDIRNRGKVLIGQEKAAQSDGTFKPTIYEMQLLGKKLKPGSVLNVPDRCNVFNFAFADITSDHSDKVIMIDNSNQLVILGPGGDQIWKSDKMFAATTNTFEGRVEDRRFNSVDLYGIPSPVLVTDLNKDGIPEIVINRSSDTINKYLPSGLKYFEKGEILSLTWDNLGLVENWKTREIAGMVTSIRIADLTNSGTPQLVVSLVMARDLFKLWEGKSTIFSYDLNISAAKVADKKAP